MVKCLFFCLSILVTLNASAQGSSNPYLLIRKIQGVEQLSSVLQRQLQRTTLQISAKQPGYDLLISASDLPEASITSVFAIESQVSKNGNRFSLEARLLDIKSKKVVTKASRSEIREEDLVRLYQAAIESLFISDEKQKPVIINSTEVQTPTRAPIQKQAIYTNSPSKNAIDLQKIIRALKQNADKAIEIAKDNNEKPSINVAEKKNQANRNIAGINSQGLSSTAQFNNPNPKVSPKFENKHHLYLGYELKKINSDSLINTTTTVHALNVEGNGHFPLSITNGHLAASYEAYVAKVIRSDNIDMPTLYTLAPGLTWLTKIGNFGAYYVYESSFFANVENQGSGLETFKINPSHLKVKADIKFKAFVEWDAQLNYLHTLSVNTDYKGVDAKSWEGSGFGIKLTPNYNYKNWKASVSFDQYSLKTQGDGVFSLNDTSLAFSLGQSF